MTASRDVILGRIRTALQAQSDLADDPPDIRDRLILLSEGETVHTLVECFRREVERVSGEFVLVHTEDEAAEQIVRLLEETGSDRMAVGASDGLEGVVRAVQKSAKDVEIVRAAELTGADRKETLAGVPFALVEGSYGVAEIGSVAIVPEQCGFSLHGFLSECVVAVVRQDRLVRSLSDLFETLPPGAARNMTLVTGPSRTADIEKILILGAHGPRRWIVAMLASEQPTR